MREPIIKGPVRNPAPTPASAVRVTDREAATGDWVLVRARMLNRVTRDSDTFALITKSGFTLKAKPEDMAGVAEGPAIDWSLARMGQNVTTPKGAGRFVCHSDGRVLVLLDGQMEPEWFDAETVV